MRIKSTLALLFLLAVFSKTDAFGRRRIRRCRVNADKKRTHSVHNPSKISSRSCTHPYRSCSIVGFGIVQKIPYLPSSLTRGPIDVQFSSACVRCGLCLAIAKQINQTLIDTHDTMLPSNWLNDTEATFLLKTICDHSFRHYSLREIHGKRYICDRIPGATLVTSTADGIWEKKLRDRCNEYLEEFGPVRLYRNWQNWSGFVDRQQDLIEVLCRGSSGIFRDCKSIENLTMPEFRTKNYRASMNVMVEFKCR